MSIEQLIHECTKNNTKAKEQQYRAQNIFEIVSENYPDEIEVESEEENITLDFLTRIIQELPDRYRLVFNLYVMDDYSHKEIAEMLNINIGTSKSNLARAKAILKEKIELNNQMSIPKIK